MPTEITYALSTSPAVFDTELKLWEKELIYEGDFEKREKDGTIRHFSVEREHMTHWVNTHAEMVAAGIEIPLPIEHTENPEARRGTVKKLATKLNASGKNALFGYIEFRDKEAEKLALTSNVSIYVPSDVSVNGKVFRTPISHVALTDYPAIPGLSKFTATIALSLSSPPVKTQGVTEMPLKDIAEKIGITVDAQTDAELETEIVDMFTAMTDEIAALKGDGDDDKETPAGDPPIAASLVRILKDNRSMKIDNLVNSGKITPAVATGLRKKYLEPAVLSLSLKSDNDDGFDSTVELFTANEPVASFKSRTGGQAGGKPLSLSDPMKSGDANPLLKDADARKAAAK